jgi:hypothetical protein
MNAISELYINFLDNPFMKEKNNFKPIFEKTMENLNFMKHLISYINEDDTNYR